VDDRPLLVVQTIDGRRFAVLELSGSRAKVVEDVDTGQRLGELSGDMVALPVTIDGEPHAIFAGRERDQPHLEHVVIELGDAAPQQHRIKSGVWMTGPLPFTPGARVSASWCDAGGRVLWRWRSPPLSSVAELEPVYGPGWIAYPVGQVALETRNEAP
jgi:hypothetical protein